MTKIEFIPNTASVDGVKKKNPGKKLVDFYKETFKENFLEA